MNQIRKVLNIFRPSWVSIAFTIPIIFLINKIGEYCLCLTIRYSNGGEVTTCPCNNFSFISNLSVYKMHISDYWGNLLIQIILFYILISLVIFILKRIRKLLKSTTR